MSVWVSIDSAPKDGTEVDLWFPTGRFQARRECRCVWARHQTGFYVREGWWSVTRHDWLLPEYQHLALAQNEPTHWMPVPAPPEELK